MKVAAILMAVWVGVFGSFLVQMAKAFGPAPLSIEPHGFAYLPAISIAAGVAGLVLSSVAEKAKSRKRDEATLPAIAAPPQLTEA